MINFIIILFHCGKLFVFVFICVCAKFYKFYKIVCGDSCVHICVNVQKLTSSVILLALFIFMLRQCLSREANLAGHELQGSTFLSCAHWDMPCDHYSHLLPRGIILSSLPSWKKQEKEKWSEKLIPETFILVLHQRPEMTWFCLRDKKSVKVFLASGSKSDFLLAFFFIYTSFM